MEIYVHTPFCVKKCKYCDFVSFDKNFNMAGEYFSCVKKELKGKSQKYGREEITSIYFGGGTPTSVKTEYLIDTLLEIKRLFNVCPDAEITVEANPGTFDKNTLITLKSGGFNRISVGVQSLIDRELNGLGRIHNSVKAIECVKSCKEVFDNVSVDLMIGLEEQTEEKVKSSLDGLLALNVDHISCYMLMVEEGTELEKLVNSGQYKPLTEDQTAVLYDFVNEYLKKNGFLRYEISNFAKNGKISKHNMGYWQMQNYIGVGISAHSLVENRRFYNTSNLNDYLQNPINELLEEQLSKEEFEREYVMLSLRTANGINKKDYQQKFGVSFEEKYKKEIDKIKPCLKITEKNISILEEYFSVSNAIMLKFI